MAARTTKDELVTLRARVEELERNRELLNAVANHAPSLLVLVDADGTVRPGATNVAFERTLGYAPDEANGLVFWEHFVPPEDAELTRHAIEDVVAGRPYGEREGRWLTSTGEVVHVLWTCTPLPPFETGPAWLLSAADISLRKQHEAEVRESRARIVAAADEARKRLERNLHDGAQQRLVALLLRLRAGVLEGAVDELGAAIEELRELARGIHPEVLTRRGLAAALRVVAARSPVPVDLEAPPERFDEQVEATAYYVVSEALANVAKYARATRVSVRVRADGDRLLVEVADDGVGGADAYGGSGLRGLGDRLAALDGELSVESPAGAGTRIHAQIPLSRTSR
ncbi:MAG TPA: PAS domain S-box protein [Gaiellaceae bacterium]